MIREYISRNLFRLLFQGSSHLIIGGNVDVDILTNAEGSDMFVDLRVFLGGKDRPKFLKAFGKKSKCFLLKFSVTQGESKKKEEKADLFYSFFG